jgi:hypothetical protein
LATLGRRATVGLEDTQIEGGDYGAPSAAIIGGPYSSGSYAGYVTHVENTSRASWPAPRSAPATR